MNLNEHTFLNAAVKELSKFVSSYQSNRR